MDAWIVYGILVVATALAFLGFVFQHCTTLHIRLCFEVRSILNCSVTVTDCLPTRREKLEKHLEAPDCLPTRREKLEKHLEDPLSKHTRRSWGGPLERGLAVKAGGPLVLGR